MKAITRHQNAPPATQWACGWSYQNPAGLGLEVFQSRHDGNSAKQVVDHRSMTLVWAGIVVYGGVCHS
ncbi:hypothetical protein D3C78_702460 [compost metagenome]